MLALLCASVLTASPDVFVVKGATPKDDEAARKAVQSRLGDKALDATALHRKLFDSGGILPIVDFDIFRASPPSGWPEPLRAVWTNGVAHCGALVGPPPWNHDLAMLQANCCSKRLGTYLWHKYLEQVGARRVVVVEEGPPPCAAQVQAFDMKTSTWVSKPSACSDVGATLDEVLDGKGTKGSWELWPELDEVPKADPFAGQKISAEKVVLKQPCAQAPGPLTLTPPTVLGAALEKRWAASVPEGGAPVACTMELFEHREPKETSLGADLTVVSALVKCGDKRASHDAAKPPLAPGGDILTKNLVTQLARELCPAK